MHLRFQIEFNLNVANSNSRRLDDQVIAYVASGFDEYKSQFAALAVRDNDLVSIHTDEERGQVYDD